MKPNADFPETQENEIFRCFGGWKRPVTFKFPTDKNGRFRRRWDSPIQYTSSDHISLVESEKGSWYSRSGSSVCSEEYQRMCGKTDLGTHINDRIIDCTFTVVFNRCSRTYWQLWRMWSMGELRKPESTSGWAILERRLRCSHEADIQGRTYPVKVIKNLNGHPIEPYKIHARKTVSCLDELSHQN